MTLNRRTVKLIALGYVVKTALFGIAWLMIPDLPARSLDIARRTWTWAVGSAQATPPPATAAPVLTAR